jgi:hypothetical protein
MPAQLAYPTDISTTPKLSEAEYRAIAAKSEDIARLELWDALEFQLVTFVKQHPIADVQSAPDAAQYLRGVELAWKLVKAGRALESVGTFGALKRPYLGFKLARVAESVYGFESNASRATPEVAGSLSKSFAEEVFMPHLQRAPNVEFNERVDGRALSVANAIASKKLDSWLSDTSQCVMNTLCSPDDYKAYYLQFFDKAFLDKNARRAIATLQAEIQDNNPKMTAVVGTETAGFAPDQDAAHADDATAAAEDVPVPVSAAPTLSDLKDKHDTTIASKTKLAVEIAELRAEIKRLSYLRRTTVNAKTGDTACALAQALTDKYQTSFPGETLLTENMWQAIREYDAHYTTGRGWYVARLPSVGYYPQAALEAIIAREATSEAIAAKQSARRELQTELAAAERQSVDAEKQYKAAKLSVRVLSVLSRGDRAKQPVPSAKVSVADTFASFQQLRAENAAPAKKALEAWVHKVSDKQLTEKDMADANVYPAVLLFTIDYLAQYMMDNWRHPELKQQLTSLEQIKTALTEALRKYADGKSGDHIEDLLAFVVQVYKVTKDDETQLLTPMFKALLERLPASEQLERQIKANDNAANMSLTYSAKLDISDVSTPNGYTRYAVGQALKTRTDAMEQFQKSNPHSDAADAHTADAGATGTSEVEAFFKGLLQALKELAEDIVAGFEKLADTADSSNKSTQRADSLIDAEAAIELSMKEPSFPKKVAPLTSNAVARFFGTHCGESIVTSDGTQPVAAVATA